MFSGALEQISSLLMKPEGPRTKEGLLPNTQLTRFYEEYPIAKEELVQNSITVTVKKSSETDKNLVQIDTDIPGDVVVHWGVCRDSKKHWEVPSIPHPPSTKIFRKKALRTLLQVSCIRTFLFDLNWNELLTKTSYYRSYAVLIFTGYCLYFNIV